MKMASERAEDFLEAQRPPECLDEAQSAAAGVPEEWDEPPKTEAGTTSTSSPPGPEEQSLLSMPCLMKELRRDSQESQQASTGSDKPASRHVYESDSSNPCMLSPSSSGHLADSDTLSSGEEPAAMAGGVDGMEAADDPGRAAETQPAAAAPGGRKSRRSRSESEMPPNAKAAKKNRSQPAVAAGAGPEKQTNGKLGKAKGHRSQKHKERMRLLRQKREAAARKKYNLLQDSSTSDSELTCDSSSSSTDDEDDDTSGGSKTIKTEIPDGPPVRGHYDVSDSASSRDSVSVEAGRPSVIRQELKALIGRDAAAGSGRIPALRSVAEPGPAERPQQMNLGSSDSEVEIVGIQEKAARCGHPSGGVIKTLSSVEPLNSSSQSQLWTSLSSPPEVVDLTLDEDVGHKFLL